MGRNQRDLEARLGSTGPLPSGSRRRKEPGIPPQGFGGSSAVPAPVAWPLQGSKCGFKPPNLCSFAAARTGDWPSWPFNSQARQVTGISVQGSSRYLGAPVSKVHQERSSSPHRAWCAESSPGEQLPSRPFSGHPSPLSILGMECTGSEPPGDSPGVWGYSMATGQAAQQNVGAPGAGLPLCRNARSPARGRASAGPMSLHRCAESGEGPPGARRTHSGCRAQRCP